jgi:hypothetical protein
MKTILLCLLVLGHFAVFGDSLTKIGGLNHGGDYGLVKANRNGPKSKPGQFVPAKVEVVNGRVVFHSGSGVSARHGECVRLLKGERIDLWKRWLWEENSSQTEQPPPRPCAGWTKLSGKILQLVGDGEMIVSRLKSDEVFWLIHGPTGVAGDEITVWAKYVGNNSYKGIFGDKRVVESYDCGTPASPLQWAESVAVLEADQKRLDDIQESSSLVQEKAKAERKAKLDEAVRKFRAEQAAKGEATNP